VIKPARGLGLRFWPKKLEAHLENLRASYLKLKANKGAPGIDGIGVEELAAHVRRHWSALASSVARAQGAFRVGRN
jgi:hypothetical protein